MLSASADKNIILWSLKQKGAQLITYAGHSDCVRSLCVFNPISDDYFYSTGNDGTIKLWNTETGEMITSVQAHANYCYSISGRKTDKTTFSCGEDASLLIYNPETNFTKNFELPCISAWSCDNNEKFAAVGTNRGELFCFTDDASLAVELAEQDFEKAVAQFKAKKEAAEQAKTENTENGLSEDELKKIPGPEVLENPGPKENFVQMVRPNANSKQVDVHQWTGGKWVLIGQAMGSNNSKDSKKLHDDGKYYDRIFEVNADTRPGQALKLPYNYTQNPWEAAQKFIETNNLAIEELEVVANFIIENIPEDKRKIYLDAESSGLNSKSSATAHGDDQPETDQLKPLNHFPETTNVAFDSVPPMDKVLVLIKNSFGESILSRQYENIMDYKVLSEIFLNGEVTDKVGSEKIFPLLDLLRLSIFQMDASQLLAWVQVLV